MSKVGDIITVNGRPERVVELELINDWQTGKPLYTALRTERVDDKTSRRRGEARAMTTSPSTAGLGRMYDVPCNGCTRCCHGDAIRLLPSDDPSNYQTEPHDHIDGELMLAHKPNGDCVYLGATGCTIHPTKPLMCREMDCRRIAQAITWTQARKLGARGSFRMDVWSRGKELLRSNTGTAPRP